MRLLFGAVWRRPLTTVLVSLMSLAIGFGCNGGGDQFPKISDLAAAPANPNFDELVGVSPVVFTGIVTGIEYGTQSSSAYPFTFVSFSRVEFLREDSQVPMEDGTLTLSFQGGMLPDHTILGADVLPKLALGEWYLIFLRGGGWRLTPIAAGGRAVFKLHGSLEDDPYVMNMASTPVVGIEKGRLAFAKPLAQTQGAKGDDISSRREASEKQASGPARMPRLSKAQIERVEDSMVMAQRSFEDSVRRESLDIDPFLAKWGQAMTLSALRKEISSREGLTQDKYSRFSKVYLRPVPTELKTPLVSPNKEVDDE